MPRKPPAPEESASPKPKRPRTPRAAAGPAARAQAKPGDIPSSLPEDRALMGEATAPTVERDGPLLLALARQSFPDLTPPEERFFRNLGIVIFGKVLPEEKDESKTLRADCLTWALLDRRAMRLLTPKGIAVSGANIYGQLDLVFCQVGLGLIISTCRLDQAPLFLNARLAFFSLQGSRCPGLHADGLQVQGGVSLRNKAVFHGEVRLLGAEIGGNFDCIGSTFANKSGGALIADRITVKGNVFLRGEAKFHGGVRLVGAEVGGNLECDGSRFVNKGGYALIADGIKVNGGVFLRGEAKFHGGVRLVGAEIGGDIDCIGSTFANKRGMALSADGIKVNGGVFLREACACRGLADFTGAEIGGFFHLHGLKRQKELFLRLSHARVGVLWDTKESWPEPGRLWVDGVQYGRLAEKAEWGLEARLDWLERHQNTGGFNPQPYEQLAKVYKEAGHEGEAKAVQIAKNWKALRFRILRFKEWVFKPWKWVGLLLQALFGVICAFGYKPFWAAGWWLGLWGYVWWRVIQLEEQHLLVPTVADLHAVKLEPVAFTASGYAFDLLTPIFDMGYTQAWTPVTRETALFLLGSGTLGYILVALFAASITGLVRK